MYCSDKCLLQEHRTRTIPLASGRKGIVIASKILIPREQRDWTVRGHIYRVDVPRQDVLRSGEILERLRVYQHREFCNVLTYCDCHVAFEYIDGPIMDASSEFSPPQWTTVNDAVSTMDASTILQGVASIGIALTLLHELGIAHTDPTGFNVMYDNRRQQWKLVDMLSCVPATPQLVDLDWMVFEKYLIKPLRKRGL